MRLKEIKELTGIRFFAALHVVFYHNYYLAGDFVFQTPAYLRRFFSFGDSAVAFFFILSGFILTIVYVDKNKMVKGDAKGFWLARLSRLYPVYLVGLILDLPRGLSYFFEKYDLVTSLKKILISLSAFLLMIQSWHPRLTPTWNSPAWSLSVEAFFYLSFPLIIARVLKIKKVFFTFIILYFLPTLFYFVMKTGLEIDFTEASVKTFWRSFPVLRLNEFLIGILLGRLYLENGTFFQWFKKDQNRIVISFLFWFSMLFSFIALSFSYLFPRELITSLFLLPCFSLMIMILASRKIIGSKLFTNKVVHLLGAASFSMYIIHQPILWYLNQIVSERSLWFFFSYVMVTIIASIFIYKLIELPLQRKIRSWLM